MSWLVGVCSQTQVHRSAVAAVFPDRDPKPLCSPPTILQGGDVKVQDYSIGSCNVIFVSLIQQMFV